MKKVLVVVLVCFFVSTNLSAQTLETLYQKIEQIKSQCPANLNEKVSPFIKKAKACLAKAEEKLKEQKADLAENYKKIAQTYIERASIGIKSVQQIPAARAPKKKFEKAKKKEKKKGKSFWDKIRGQWTDEEKGRLAGRIVKYKDVIRNIEGLVKGSNNETAVTALENAIKQVKRAERNFNKKRFSRAHKYAKVAYRELDKCLRNFKNYQNNIFQDPATLGEAFATKKEEAEYRYQKSLALYNQLMSRKRLNKRTKYFLKRARHYIDMAEDVLYNKNYALAVHNLRPAMKFLFKAQRATKLK